MRLFKFLTHRSHAAKDRFSRLTARLTAFARRRGPLLFGLLVPLVLFNLTYGLWEISYQPNFCNTCHIIRPYVTSYKTSEHTDNKHYQANVGCKDCHKVTPISALGEVATYLTFGYQDPLKQTKLPKDNCLTCHRDYESLAAQTADLENNPHDAHWPDMECNVCHKAHGPSVDTCGECHESGHNILP